MALRLLLDTNVISNLIREPQGPVTRSISSAGEDDLLIAAHALSLGLTVVTANVREFSRVPALKVGDWTSS